MDEKVLQIPVERLLMIIGRQAAEIEMLRELVAQKLNPPPPPAPPAKRKGD